MTPKQILDSFSETLMRDERILSAQERALVPTLLQHARTSTGENQQTQDAVRAVIASAIGETVAQRAFAVLGGSILERILVCGVLSAASKARPTAVHDDLPQPPGPAPSIRTARASSPLAHPLRSPRPGSP